MKPKLYSLFSYYPDNGYRVDVNPDPPKPHEARPFWVLIRGKSWVPVTALVFARSEQHAEARIRSAIRICNEHHVGVRPHWGKNVEPGIESGEFELSVQPADVAQLAFKANWSDEGGLA